MEIKERLTKARIKIQKSNPFFAYLSLYLKFKKDDTLPDYALAGVDKHGNFYYKEEGIQELSDEEIQAVVIHEILHLSFLHLLRLGSRNQLKWNLACDCCVNKIIQDNGYTLPKGSVVPEINDNSITILKSKIEDVGKKTAEEIYHEIKDEKKQQGKGQGQEDSNGNQNQQGQNQQGNGNNPNYDEKSGFDEHKFAKNLSEKEEKELIKKWESRTHEALTIAKMRGNIPKGIERYVGELHKETIDWKSLLNQYITQQIPYDYSYNKPSKKSISVGEYMPHTLKEKIEIIVGIDLSGSIGKEELTDFFSEIIGIAKAYQERIDFKVYTHDTEAYYCGEVRNGNIEKIKEIEIKGGGGTSHIEIFDKIQKEQRNCKLALFFTDGESDLNGIDFNNYSFNKLFVLNKNGTDRQLKDKQCMTIQMRENTNG